MVQSCPPVNNKKKKYIYINHTFVFKDLLAASNDHKDEHERKCIGSRATLFTLQETFLWDVWLAKGSWVIASANPSDRIDTRSDRRGLLQPTIKDIHKQPGQLNGPVHVFSSPIKNFTASLIILKKCFKETRFFHPFWTPYRGLSNPGPDPPTVPLIPGLDCTAGYSFRSYILADKVLRQSFSGFLFQP